MKNFQGIKICLPFKYYNTFNNAICLSGFGLYCRWVPLRGDWHTQQMDDKEKKDCKLQIRLLSLLSLTIHPLSVANSWRNIKLSLLLFPVGSLNLSHFSSSSSPSAVHLFLAPQRYLRVTIRSHSSRRSKDQTALGLNGTFPFGWSDARYVPRFKHCSLLPHTLTNSFSISSTL